MSELSFTVVDIIFVLFVLASASYAAWRGLMRETLSIFSWAVSAYLTLRFFPVFRPMLHGRISPEWLSEVVVFIGMLVITLVPLSFLAFRISETVKKSPVGPVDRVLGFFFGVARGAAVIGIAFVLYGAMTGGGQPQWLTQSMSYPIVQATGDLILSLVPGGDGVTQDQAGIVPRPQPAPERAVNAAGRAPGGAASPQGPGYDAQERSELDRLIQTTGGN